MLVCTFNQGVAMSFVEKNFGQINCPSGDKIELNYLAPNCLVLDVNGGRAQLELGEKQVQSMIEGLTECLAEMKKVMHQ
jgi:hypothetical protein